MALAVMSAPGAAAAGLDNNTSGNLLWMATKELFRRGEFICAVFDTGKTYAGEMTAASRNIEDGRGSTDDALGRELGKIRFSLFSVDTSDVYSLDYSYGEFEQLFRFNAELMNPNKKSERFYWVLRRLDLVPDGSGGLRLALQSAETSERPRLVVSSENKHNIPIGKLNYLGRAKLRESMVELDKKRTALIDQKDQERRLKFLARIAEERRAAEGAARVRERKVREERDEKRAQQLRERHQAIQREEQRKEKEATRSANIAVLKAQREANEKNIISVAFTEAVFERQRRAAEKKKEKEKEIERRTEERIERERAERQQYEEHMRLIEGRRQTAWRQREQRFKDRAAAQNMERQRGLDNKFIRDKLLHERKIEAVAGLNEARKKVYEDYVNEKKLLSGGKEGNEGDVEVAAA
ncbi:hypothetical protein FOZ61_009963 [Perkinsus olseni]|uniref:Uncharacterized protein n=1 Tax=Perkinsus olseni TaxID=32597 RepID=A0A7J6M440_PEROL|nr:hypothetical protein FOZ61_009963 [Perkinsus olseni]KAF4672404.1 hypothetical protein FOL46_009032 [Perkinsus olseni]